MLMVVVLMMVIVMLEVAQPPSIAVAGQQYVQACKQAMQAVAYWQQSTITRKHKSPPPCTVKRMQ
eukprot:1155975-Pelagomonas_calceolata.AAC.2